MEELMLVYVENADGVYSAYASKSDPYVATTNLKEAKLDRWTAETLIRTTAEYNESQRLLYSLFND